MTHRYGMGQKAISDMRKQRGSMTIKERLDNIKALRDEAIRKDEHYYAGVAKAYTTSLNSMVAMLKELREKIDSVESPKGIKGVANVMFSMGVAEIEGFIPPTTELDVYTKEEA